MYFFLFKLREKAFENNKNLGQTQGKVRSKTVVNPAANDKLWEKIIRATN